MNLVWRNSGKPQHKFKIESATGYCACCGIEIYNGVPVKDVIGTAFSRQSEFMPHGSHVCDSCAWMCSDVKITHRNVIAAGDKIWWPMISHDSATEERQSWFDVLRKVAEMQADTPIIGVLTTDPKPRLWPMAQQRTVSDFGLYVHCPDYDISGFVEFDLNECLKIAGIISARMLDGYSKRACYFGLLSDMKKAKKDIYGTLEKERELAALRHLTAFVPGLLIAGKKKDEPIGESCIYSAQQEQELPEKTVRNSRFDSPTQQSLL